MNGYASEGYAISLSEFGQPRFLPMSEGWIQERPIQNSSQKDARAMYPLFSCNKWTHLPQDLDVLQQDSGLVSLVIVTDPFGDYDEGLLHSCFPDLVRSFKRHYLVDMISPFQVSKHHRYYTRKSLEKVRVETCTNPVDLLDEWMALYGVLVSRHKITGIQTFSQRAFEQQLALPNVTAFCSLLGDRIIGMHLWIRGNDIAYSHLTAFHEEGYQLNASYALYSYAIDYFAGQVRWLDLGSGAGLEDNANDGLSKFKRGWSNAERNVYLCGRIFDRTAYDLLVQQHGIKPTTFFPAYRSGDFQ